MSEILLLHKQDAAEAIVATALISRLLDEGHRVTCASDTRFLDILEYCGCKVEHIDAIAGRCCDIAINLCPSVSCTDAMNTVEADERLGYGQDEDGLVFFNEGAQRHYRSKYVRIPSPWNQFQLVFALAGRTWKGEGYGLKYFPRNRTKPSLTGVAIRDHLLREYIIANLQLAKTRLWKVPIKESMRKQIDEINRCKNIVTDDIGIVHASLALRKNVEFLTPKLLPYRLETFGGGHVHLFDARVLRND